MNKKFIGLCATIMLCTGVVAQDDEAYVQQLDEVVVSDSRFELKRENSGKTVIKITSSITDPQTRVKDNSFETNDSIGLFVLTQPNKLSEERCVNNACFTYSLNSVFISEKDLFYPDGNYKCDFISYYPYQKSGIKAGQTELIVSINKN